jgi:hypothetical protein
MPSSSNLKHSSNGSGQDQNNLLMNRHSIFPNMNQLALLAPVKQGQVFTIKREGNNLFEQRRLDNSNNGNRLLMVIH